jgi:formylglycine-generating enzyme required for sulfatase activity
MIEPIEPQTVETGKLLTVAVPVENPEAWEGKLRYALSGSPPSGASVDAQTGVLTWTPKAEQLSDKYTVTVSVEAPDGRRAEATVEVTVTAPVPLKLKPIEPQTVEAGKSLTLAAPVWNADAWRGNVQYGVAGQAPSGARIDAQSGAFSWLAPSDQAAGKLDVVVSVESPDGRKDQTTFTITVTRPAPQEEEAVGTETVPGTAAAPKGTLDEGGDVPGQWTRPSTTPANPFPGRDKQVSFDLGAGIKLEMVLIPEGEFLMGSPDSEEKANVDEKPAHRVRITAPFYMGKHLVTQEQWEAVMGDNPSMFRDPKNPVETVSWDDCQSFLDKLNGKLGAGWGTFKLPTEAQWEYACRARNMTNYCFGDNESGLRKNAWYGENSHGRTHPVGEKKPNAWGLFDMHGNVWEWCQDWYDGNYYAQSPGDDPSGPAQGSHRVNRGGSWSYSAWGCRCAYRHGLAPESRGSHVGLRVCSVRTDKQG